MKVFNFSHIGRRSSQEDSYYIDTDTMRLFILCDGVGGNHGGKVQQGFIDGNVENILKGLSNQYGASIQIGKAGQPFFQEGNIRVDLTSSSDLIPTLRINSNGILYAIRAH